MCQSCIGREGVACVDRLREPGVPRPRLSPLQEHQLVAVIESVHRRRRRRHLAACLGLDLLRMAGLTVIGVLAVGLAIAGTGLVRMCLWSSKGGGS